MKRFTRAVCEGVNGDIDEKLVTIKDSSPFTPRSSRKRAFTLAEVLITLGIIGIVAAMTMPTLMANHKKKTLEVQYKKSVAAISQAILMAKTQMGLDYFADYCIAGKSNETNYVYINQQECNQAIFRQFHKAKEANLSWGNGGAYSIQRNSNEIKTYIGKDISSASLAGISWAILDTNPLPDGSFFNSWIIESQLYLAVDINGYKKPNKLGHDIFVFTLDKEKDTLSSLGRPQDIELSEEELESDDYSTHRRGNPCNLTSSSKANGIGCAYYALRNECPYDSSKTYFECLP